MHPSCCKVRALEAVDAYPWSLLRQAVCRGGSAVPQGGQVRSAWEAFQSLGTQDNRRRRAGARDRASLWFRRGFFLLLRAKDTRRQRPGQPRSLRFRLGPAEGGELTRWEGVAGAFSPRVSGRAGEIGLHLCSHRGYLGARNS